MKNWQNKALQVVEELKKVLVEMETTKKDYAVCEDDIEYVEFTGIMNVLRDQYLKLVDELKSIQ